MQTPARRHNATSPLGRLKQRDGGGSAVLLPKALKGWPQINAFAESGLFPAAKGTAPPLIALLICEIHRATRRKKQKQTSLRKGAGKCRFE